MFELELKNVRIRERRAKQEDLSRKCTEREGRRTKDKIDRRGDEDPEKEEERWGGRGSKGKRGVGRKREEGGGEEGECTEILPVIGLQDNFWGKSCCSFL